MSMVHDPISVLDALMIALSGIVIVFLMLAFNLLGNGLRDAFNPTLRQ